MPRRRAQRWLLPLCAALPGGAAAPVPTAALRNGVRIPMALLGVGNTGTWGNASGTATAVALGLSPAVGFPGVDTANHYANQAAVAAGLRAAGVRRGDVWLQTKVEGCGAGDSTSPIREGSCRADTQHVFAENLRLLNTTYVDLMLLHAPPCLDGCVWAPVAVYPQHLNCSSPAACDMMREQWAALEDMYLDGKARAIGVSNYCRACLECLGETRVPVMVNQLQHHAGMAGADPGGLFGYLKQRGILPQAYSPLAGGTQQTKPLLTAPALARVADAHNKSTAQVALRWVAQQGVPFITAPAREDYMLEDVDVFSWDLSPAEADAINAVVIPRVPGAAVDDPVKGMCIM